MKTQWVKRCLVIYVILVFGYLVFGEFLLPADDLGEDWRVTEYQGDWFRLLENGDRVPQEVPGSSDAERGEQITLTTVLPQSIPEETFLCFRSGKQDMEFWIDGVLRQVYETNDTRMIGSYSPVAYVFVKIRPEDAGKELKLTAQTGSTYSGIFYTVYQGTQLAIWGHYFQLYGAELIIAVLVLMLSTIVIIASLVMQRYYRREIELKYLGWGVFFAGVWEIANSVFRQLMFPNLSVISDLAFYMVMLLPIPFLLYANEIQNGRYSLYCRILETLAVLDFLVCTTLHITGLVDFNETFLLMASVCVLVIMMLLVTIVYDSVRGYIREYLSVSWGMFCAFVSAIVQIATYFQRTKTFSGVILSVGLLLLMFFATINTIQNLVHVEREKQSALMASKSKGEFLAKMSHEIRTPINAVLGLDEMILRESSEPQIREYAVDIENAGHTLLSLINDILDLSKIESGKMGIVYIDYDFSSLLIDVINMVSMKAEAKGLKLELKLDETLPSGLYGDDVRLRQILVNLMNNAVKYTQEGSVTLEISGSTTEDEDELLLHFAVRDTGVGIKEEDRDKLFEAFERIEEEDNRQIEGTGLGMSITVQLLELMESKLCVDSVYGEGSVFYFDLIQRITKREPLGDLQERVATRAQAHTYEALFLAPDARVLLVDDNAMNRKVFIGLLRQTGLQIEEADNGAHALEMASQKAYDMIFLDYMMPDMNGIEVLQSLQQLEQNPNKDTPVIALTANAISGVRKMYLDAGFTDYLSKPVSPEKLEKMIRNYLPKEKWKHADVPVPSEVKKEPSAAAMQELPEVEGVDFPYALQKLKKQSFLWDVVKDFCLLADDDMKELRGYFLRLGRIPQEESDERAELLRQYRVKVHAMKTSAAMLGALGVSSLAKLLEYAARDRNLERIEALEQPFEEEWELLKNRLQAVCRERELITEETKEKEQAPDKEELVHLLEKLRDAMDEMDVDTADEIIEQLSKKDFEGETQDLIGQLTVAVRNLDYERVDELVDGFRG